MNILSKRFWFPFLVLAAVVLLWQFVWPLYPLLPTFIIPLPSTVILYLAQNFSFLLSNLLTTLYESVFGFVAGAAIGIALAIAITYSQTLQNILYPLIVVSQVIPKVAIAPLIVFILGFGLLNKVVVALLIAFFPVVVGTVLGFSSVPQEILDLAKCSSAGQWKIFAKVKLPYSLPFMFSGFEIAITYSVVGAISAEWIQADSGLGFLLLTAAGQLNADLMFASLLLATVVGGGLFIIILVLERLIMPWKRPTEEEIPVQRGM